MLQADERFGLEDETDDDAGAMSATRHAPLLHIGLLGPLHITHAGQAIHLPRRKVESLLAYLILHPEQHARDHLATLLWGDSPDERARQSLRMALATVRQVISPDLLLTTREHVQLNPNFPLSTDLQTLLALETEAEGAPIEVIHAKVALWQGELLAGSYEEWLVHARDLYHNRLLTLLLQVVQTLRARSEYAQAIRVAQRVLDFDPANELAHQHLMFCYLSSGDRPAALRQYEQCVRALADDVDAPPSPETIALYTWIKQNSWEAATTAKITNLPIPITSFVGRTRESAEVKRLLIGGGRERKKARLLTLLGAGGNGKTRLSIQVATDLIDSFAHGVWWVELGALSDDALVGRAVAKTLGVRETGDEALSETIAHFIGDKQMLLVIDNCEHLVAPTAQMAAALLAQCPDLHILTTSRESLNIVGETLWHVPTFAAPDPTQLGMVELLLQYESVRLFVERAAAVQPGFTLTLENAQAVAEICQRLDGIPLAIELAAARMKVLTVGQIARYLTSALGARFTLLTQGSRVVQPRHQTLRATIDWSYNLLDEAERTLFRQVATFRGGFTLDLLTEVVGDGQIDPQLQATTLDLLTQLVDKSLVMVEQQGTEKRYSLLETLREYALAQASADEIAHLQAQHAATFLRLAENAAHELIGPQQSIWLDRLETEHANIRGALEFWLTVQAPESVLQLAAAMVRFWEFRGYVSEGREWLDKALASRHMITPIAVAPTILAKALNGAGVLAWRQSDFEAARPLLTESLDYFTQNDDAKGEADALQTLAAVNMSQGEYALAEAQLARSLALCRAHADDYGMARAENFLGNLALDQNRYTEACAHYLASLHLYQQIGDPVSMAVGYFNVGNASRQLADFVAARTNYEASLAISRQVGHKGLIGVALRNLGVVAFDLENYPEARRYSEEALVILGELGDRGNMAFVYSNLGNVALALGDAARAFGYYCQKLALLHAVGHRWGTFYALEEIAAFLGEGGLHADWAVRLMAAAQLMREEADLPIPPTEEAEYHALLATLRHAVGEDAFAQLWEAGRVLPLSEVVAGVTRLSLTSG